MKPLRRRTKRNVLNSVVSGHRLRTWIPAFLILVGVAVFWNSRSGVFLFDDFASIHQNETIKKLWPLTAALSPPNKGESVAGRPLVNLSLAINFAFGGLDPTGYHVSNIALHIACALLVFAIIRRVVEKIAAHSARGPKAISQVASFVALLWMVHPLQSEVVNYITARTESMMALFYLLTIYAAIRSQEEKSRVWTLFAIASCALGMTCKESMATAPVAVVLIDRALFFDSFSTSFDKRKQLYFALASSWIVLAALVAATPRGNSAGFNVLASSAVDVTVSGYLLNQAPIVSQYLKLLLWPDSLVLDYGPTVVVTFGQVWFQAVLILFLLVVSALLWVRRPLYGLAGALFFLTLAPTTLVPIVSEVGAERRMYLPSISLLAAIVIVCSRLWTVRVTSVVGLLTATVLAIVTVDRNREFSSSYEMWRTVVDRRHHGRAYLNLAVESEKSGRISDVIPLLENAVVDFPDAEYPLGARLYEAGRYEEAVTHLQEFLRRRATHYQAPAAKAVLIRSLTDLGIARARRGSETAIDAFQRAVELDPRNAELRRNLANGLLANDRLEDAEREIQQVLRDRPTDAAALEILSEVRQRKRGS